MDEQREDQQDTQLPSLLHLTREQVALASGTMLAATGVDLLAHLGPTGLVVGGILAFAAARHGQGLYAQVQGLLSPAPAPPRRSRPMKRRGDQRSVLDRALGRFPDALEAEGPLTLEDENPVWEETDRDEPAVPGVAREQRRTTSRMLLDLAPDLHLDLDDLAGKAIFIAGIRRSGKTTLGARIAEELGKWYIPLFLPDLEGDLLALAEVLPRAIIAHGPRTETADYQSSAYTVHAATITVQNAFTLGYDILDKGYQVLLDLASYPSLEEAIGVQVSIIRGLFCWADEHPAERTTCQVYLDEAQRYLPQTLDDSVIQDKIVRSELLRAYMDIIAIGGKRGIAPVILTQRLAQVNKKIMAQSEVLFLMKQTMDNDLARCMEYVKRSTATEEMIARLSPGQGIYIGADGTQRLTQFHKRQSSGARSHTPRAAVALRYAQMPIQPIMPPLAQPASPPYTQQQAVPAASPAETHQLPVSGSIASKMVPTRHTSAAISPELERALNAYKQGKTTCRELAADIGVGKTRAAELIQQLKAKRLLAGEEAVSVRPFPRVTRVVEHGGQRTWTQRTDGRTTGRES
jgi:hypothetical protein